MHHDGAHESFDRVENTDAVENTDRVEAGDDGKQAPGVFRKTLVRVMAVQVVSLLLLWFVQMWFG